LHNFENSLHPNSQARCVTGYCYCFFIGVVEPYWTFVKFSALLHVSMLFLGYSLVIYGKYLYDLNVFACVATHC